MEWQVALSRTAMDGFTKKGDTPLERVQCCFCVQKTGSIACSLPIISRTFSQISASFSRAVRVSPECSPAIVEDALERA